MAQQRRQPYREPRSAGAGEEYERRAESGSSHPGRQSRCSFRKASSEMYTFESDIGATIARQPGG
jgi:hypothetical protein